MVVILTIAIVQLNQETQRIVVVFKNFFFKYDLCLQPNTGIKKQIDQKFQYKQIELIRMDCYSHK